MSDHQLPPIKTAKLALSARHVGESLARAVNEKKLEGVDPVASPRIKAVNEGVADWVVPATRRLDPPEVIRPSRTVVDDDIVVPKRPARMAESRLPVRERKGATLAASALRFMGGSR